MRSQQAIDIALTQIGDWIAPDGVTGVAAAVWHNGEIACERYAGESRPGTPVDEQTLFGLASVTKPVTAAVVVSLVSEGTLGLDDPVVQYLPSFAESTNPDDQLINDRSVVTIRQLLSHLAGLPEDLPTGTFRSRDLPTYRQITDRMIGLPLSAIPGELFRYSNAGYGILGRVVEVVTSSDFWDIAWEQIQKPMSLNDLVARPGPALDARIATVQDVKNAGKESEAYNGQYWRDLAIPWGGLFGTARDLARFAGGFLSTDNDPVPEPWKSMMTTDQVVGRSGGVDSLRVSWDPAWWGLGWEVKGTKRNHWTGQLTSSATFCHFGASGTLVWADPAHGIALAVFGNRMVTYQWPFDPPRWARLSNSLIEAVS